MRRSAVFMLALLVCACALVPVWKMLLPIDALTVDLSNRYARPAVPHLLGTDEVGRDVLMRLLQGGLVSLAIAGMATLCTLLIGGLLGGLSGYYGGRLDRALMMLTDGVIALPLLPFLIILAAVDTARLGLPPGGGGEGLKLVLALSLFGWTTIARLIRSDVLSLREREFIKAARALGGTSWRILSRHIFPNTFATLSTAVTLTFIKMILLEAGISYLGMGITPPNPTLGNLLMNAQHDLWQAPQLAIYPGILLTLVVLCLLVLSEKKRTNS
jgi:peptide/nickel transport system permease protein